MRRWIEDGARLAFFVYEASRRVIGDCLSLNGADAARGEDVEALLLKHRFRRYSSRQEFTAQSTVAAASIRTAGAASGERVPTPSPAVHGGEPWEVPVVAPLTF